MLPRTWPSASIDHLAIVWDAILEAIGVETQRAADRTGASVVGGARAIRPPNLPATYPGGMRLQPSSGPISTSAGTDRELRLPPWADAHWIAMCTDAFLSIALVRTVSAVKLRTGTCGLAVPTNVNHQGHHEQSHPAQPIHPVCRRRLLRLVLWLLAATAGVRSREPSTNRLQSHQRGVVRR